MKILVLPTHSSTMDLSAGRRCYAVIPLDSALLDTWSHDLDRVQAVCLLWRHEVEVSWDAKEFSTIYRTVPFLPPDADGTLDTDGYLVLDVPACVWASGQGLPIERCTCHMRNDTLWWEFWAKDVLISEATTALQRPQLAALADALQRSV